MQPGHCFTIEVSFIHALPIYRDLPEEYHVAVYRERNKRRPYGVRGWVDGIFHGDFESLKIRDLY